jgi:hypothetical protein
MGNKGGRSLVVSAEEYMVLVFRIFDLLVEGENPEATGG